MFVICFNVFNVTNHITTGTIHVYRFKIDVNYIGEPPSIEVTICQLNDNIDKQFLRDMVQKFGVIEELFIYYHPVTNKHLGLGRVVFETVQGAKACVEKLNDTSVMGKRLQVFLDPFGEKCKQIFEEAVAEKKPPPVEEKQKPEPEPKKVEEEKKPVEKEHERDSYHEKVKDRDDSKYSKERDRDRIDRERDRDRLYSRGYVHSSRNDFATPSSSDLGYNTAASEYSASFGSAGTTPLQ